MMTVSLPDGQEKGPDGRPKARNVKLADITDGTSSTLAMVEKRDSYGWAVGGFGGSEFDVNTQPNFEQDDALGRKVYSGSVHRQGVHCALVRRIGAPARAGDRPGTLVRADHSRRRRAGPARSSRAVTEADRRQGRAAGDQRTVRADAKSVGKLVDLLRKNPPAASKSKTAMNLFALEIASGKVTLVASEPDPGLDCCGSPAWTQDGQRILFDAQPRDHLEKTRLKATRCWPVSDGRFEIWDRGTVRHPRRAATGSSSCRIRIRCPAPRQESGSWGPTAATAGTWAATAGRSGLPTAISSW